MTSNFPQFAQGQSGAYELLNECLAMLFFAATFAMDPETTTGLTFGLRAGRWGGVEYAGGTFALTASSTTYVVVHRADGVPSASTSYTNWNDSTNYARAYRVITDTASITDAQDHRGGPGGAHGSGAAITTAP